MKAAEHKNIWESRAEVEKESNSVFVISSTNNRVIVARNEACQVTWFIDIHTNVVHGGWQCHSEAHPSFQEAIESHSEQEAQVVFQHDHGMSQWEWEMENEQSFRTAKIG